MPVRVVCPSCATQLNIKEEHAARAVKCPKCGFVIQPTQAAPPAVPTGSAPFDAPAVPAIPSDAPPAPPPLPPSAPPRATPATGRPVGTRRDPDDEPRRPTGRKSRDDDDDRDDDRPRPRRRPAGDDDDDDSAPKKKSKTGLILTIILGVLLLCCGVPAGVGFWIYTAAQKKLEEAKEFLENSNFRIHRPTYDRVKINMTRTQVDELLGDGKVVTVEDLPKYFTNPSSGYKPDDFRPLAEKGRLVVWRNNDDFLLGGFYPDASGKLQVKAWHPKAGATASDGTPKDDLYLAKWAKIDPNAGTETGPAEEVKAEVLAKEYKDDATAADAKYKDKWLVVEGKLNEITQQVLGDVPVRLEGLPPGPGKPLGTDINCVLPPAAGKDAWKLSRGQTVKIRGKCLGFSDPFVTLQECKIEGNGPDPSVQLQTAAFLAEHAKNPEATDDKYKDKQVTLSGAVVESKEEAAVILVSSSKKGPPLKIKATLPFDLRKQLDTIKVGGSVKVKGEYAGSSAGTIYLNRCWIAP